MFENVSSSFPAQPAFRENDLSGLPVGDPSPHQKSLQKSPQIYWDNVSKWYSVILNAADTWPVVLAEISQRSDSEYASPSEETLQRIGKDLLAAQTRLRKALMKVMESLLKRPGQITEPEELRFFLILLENPLLHSDTSHTVPSDKRYTLSAGSASAAADPSGRCSRILKRIIGLISNLPAELQNQLATWWSQYQAEQFAKTKDLIFGFLIYRTKRHEKHIRDGNDSDGKFNSTQNDEITHRTSRKQAKTKALKTYDCSYADDWQIKAASRVLSMLFDANNPYSPNRMDEPSWSAEPGLWRPSAAKGLFLPMSEFYNLLIDNIDVIDDFTGWETKSRRFSFCQYPFLLTIGAKMRILENYLYREMEHHRGGSFFHNVSNSRNTTHRGSFLLNVRRECLVEDTFKALDENLNSMRDQTKMPLMVRFQGEEGIDGGGLRNELFLLLGRDMFNPDRGELSAALMRNPSIVDYIYRAFHLR